MGVSGSPVSSETEWGQSKHQDQRVGKHFWRQKLVTAFDAGHTPAIMHIRECLYDPGHVLWAWDASLLRVKPIMWQMLCLRVLPVLLSGLYGLCHIV